MTALTIFLQQDKTNINISQKLFLRIMEAQKLYKIT